MRTDIGMPGRRILALCLIAVMILAGPVQTARAAENVYQKSGESNWVGPLDDGRVFSALEPAGVKPASKAVNTLMIYMVGTNLEADNGYGSDDFNDMMTSGFDPSRSNVLVYTGGAVGWQNNIPSDRNCVYRVEQEKAGVVALTPQISDTGDPRSLADFINFATEYFPADHYGLVLWDHGGGPLMGFGHDDYFYSHDLYGNPESEEYRSNDGLMLDELQDAMDATMFGGAAKLDLVLYNACLMASVESAKSWQPYANMYISSEESISGYGVPYGFLKELNTKDLSQIAPDIVETYESYYAERNESRSAYMMDAVDATLSAVDLSSIDGVSSAVDALFARAADGLTKGDYEALQQIREEMYEFDPESAGTVQCFDLVDCVDMAEQMAALYPQEAKALQDAVKKAVVSETSNVERAHGLMMYYPQHGLLFLELIAPRVYGDLVVSASYETYLDMVKEVWSSGDPDLWVGQNVTTEPETTTAEEAEAETTTATEAETTTAAPETTAAAETAPETTTAAATEPETTAAAPETTAATEAEPETTAAPETTTAAATEPETTTAAATEAETTNAEEPETTAAPAEVPAGAVSWTIPDPSWAKVTYSLCEVRDDGAYRPVLCDVPLTPDAAGTVFIDPDPAVFCIQSDVTSAAVPWTATEVSRNGDTVDYRLAGTMMASGPEFTAPTDDGQPLVTVIVSAKADAAEGKLKQIRPVQENAGPLGFDDIDPEDWEGLYEYLYDYQPGTNADGTVKPIREWTATGNALFRMLPIEDQMYFVKKKISELSGEYAVMFQEKTAAGEVKCSALIPIPKAAVQEQTASTGSGTLTAAVFSDHAEITGYEGSDSSLTIPGEIGGVPVTAIAPRALRAAESVTELVIADSITSIGEAACAGMTALQSVSLPAGLQAIGYHAFYGDAALTAVAIPEGTQVIGRAAFQGCESLAEADIPGSVTVFGHAVFAQCPKLAQIRVTAGAACKSDGNLLLSADGKTLLAVPEGAGTYVKVPDGVETVAYGAFSGAKSIKKVDFPAGLKRIENFAFYDCTSLVGVELPDSVEYIGTKAFGANTTVFMSDYERAPIAQVKLGGAVRHVGVNAFVGCNLTAFEVAEDNDSWMALEGFLANKAGDMIWEAPAGLTGTVTIPDGVVTLRENLFTNNINVTDFVLPDTLVNIPEDCFPVAGYDTSGGEIKPTYDITLHCSAGSAAAAYAEAHGIAHVE